MKGIIVITESADGNSYRTSRSWDEFFRDLHGDPEDLKDSVSQFKPCDGRQCTPSCGGAGFIDADGYCHYVVFAINNLKPMVLSEVEVVKKYEVKEVKP